jgi:hypothetical protein
VSDVADGVFLSYRRADTQGIAGRLADRLRIHFTKTENFARVFIDVEAVKPGAEFARAVTDALDRSAVLLAVIGPSWLAVEENGQRRLDAPDDMVAFEIRTALDRRVHVVPVLVDGATMPSKRDLPVELAGLAGRNAIHVRHVSFDADIGPLLNDIDEQLRNVHDKRVSAEFLDVVISTPTQTCADSMTWVNAKRRAPDSELSYPWAFGMVAAPLTLTVCVWTWYSFVRWGWMLLPAMLLTLLTLLSFGIPKGEAEARRFERNLRDLRVDADGLGADRVASWRHMRFVELTEEGVLGFAPVGRSWLTDLRPCEYVEARQVGASGAQETVETVKYRSPPCIDTNGTVALCDISGYRNAYADVVIAEIDKHLARLAAPPGSLARWRGRAASG